MEVWMGVKLADVLSRLPDDRRRKEEACAQALIAQEISLRDVRKRSGMA
jgi:hypothetical protein